MIDTPTLFVLGAGASKPYGYLTGAELRNDIINNFATDFQGIRDIRDVLRNYSSVLKGINAFIETFSNSSILSIDKYLSLNPSDIHFGQLAITLSILKSEKQSKFRHEIENPSEDWYTYLINRMLEGFNKPDDYKKFSKNNVAFITFNYDRSLEYILYDSFYNSFKDSRNDIDVNINNHLPFKIIHVYGVVYQLSPMTWAYGNQNNSYKADFNNYDSIKKMSDGIRVIGDRSDLDVKNNITNLLKGYKKIFFLGFGYAQENLDAIGLLNNIDHTWTVYGTAKGMTPKEINDVKNRFPVTKGDTHYAGTVVVRENDKKIKTIIEDRNCYDLLREYL